MKKKFFLTVAFAFIAVCVFAQERIAVFPFEDLDNIFTPNEMVMFYREFSNEFATRSTGRFLAVPRLEIERLINIETAFQLTDFSAREKTAEMQRVLNGTQILSGLIARVNNNIRITISLYTFPELAILPGGTTLTVGNKNELFSRIPELVQKMTTEIINHLPLPNPFIGRWRSTIVSNRLTLICILDFNSDGSIDVEQYDTNRVTQHSGGMRYSNDRRTGSGDGTYSIRNSGSAVIADISLTISSVSHEFTAVTAQARFVANNPNSFTIFTQNRNRVDHENSMKCEFYVTDRRISDSYIEFHKL